MAVLTSKKSNHISQGVELAKDTRALIHRLRTYRADALAQGFTSQVQGGPGLVDADFTGDNQHVDAAAYRAFLTTAQKIVEFYDDNGGNNVAATSAANANANPDKKILALCNDI